MTFKRPREGEDELLSFKSYCPNAHLTDCSIWTTKVVNILTRNESADDQAAMAYSVFNFAGREST